jgi:hypothetical protein
MAPAAKWTAAEILEHLYLTYRGTNKGIGKCLEGDAPFASAITLKNRVQTFLVVTLRYFPGGRKAPTRAVPQGMPAEEVGRVVFEEIDQMIAGLAECERRFGRKTRVFDHPVLGPLTSRQWSRFHVVHGLHHARQIRERLARG